MVSSQIICLIYISFDHL
ncbi:hypothetical protein Zm00014a_010816 [Zea mays]|uniref:Uncharacterized protein n=1 Tax=Zea mays TaxID=4577 RepID=A0A3L6FT70_MAIZE|nr:hypothetical protein Zm00014a_010816 [Zea mays]